MKRPKGVLREEFRKAVESNKNIFEFPDKIEVIRRDERPDHPGFLPVYVVLSTDGTVTFCEISKRPHGLLDFHMHKVERQPGTGLHLLWPTRYLEKILATRIGQYIAFQFHPLPDLMKPPFDYTEDQSLFSFNRESPFGRGSVHLIIGLSVYSNYVPLGPANHGHFMPLHLIDDVNALKNIPIEKYLTAGAKAVWKDNGFRIACDSIPSLLHKIDRYVDAYIQEENLCDRLWLSTQSSKAKKGEKINGSRVWPWITVVTCLTLVIAVMLVSMLRNKRRLRNPILFRR